MQLDTPVAFRNTGFNSTNKPVYSLHCLRVAQTRRESVTLEGIRGLILNIEQEDGSGWSWNVTMLTTTSVCPCCNKGAVLTKWIYAR